MIVRRAHTLRIRRGMPAILRRCLLRACYHNTAARACSFLNSCGYRSVGSSADRHNNLFRAAKLLYFFQDSRAFLIVAGRKQGVGALLGKHVRKSTGFQFRSMREDRGGGFRERKGWRRERGGKANGIMATCALKYQVVIA